MSYRPNPGLFGLLFGSKEPKLAKSKVKSKLSIDGALKAAYKAGFDIGDTAEFPYWLQRTGLDHRGEQLRQKLRLEFGRGVDGVGAGEHKKKQPGPKMRLGKYLWWREGDFWRTNLDPDSEFESAKDVKAFITNQSKNPCGPWKKKTVTDRAHRYRANSKGCKPTGPKRCLFCGSDRSVIVHHLDGFEENTTPENLSYACKSCNTQLGAVYAEHRLGRKTKQYNPEGGAKTVSQWVAAVTSICRRAPGRAVCTPGAMMPVPQALEIIRATSPADRSRFARSIWSSRARAARSSVPF